jgi:hypothetical protein
VFGRQSSQCDQQRLHAIQVAALPIFPNAPKSFPRACLLTLNFAKRIGIIKMGGKKKLDDPDLDTNSPRNFHNSDWRLDFHSSKSETPDDGRF